MRVRFTAAALAEMTEIRDYIAKDNPAAAKAVVLRIEQVIARIAQFRISPTKSMNRVCGCFRWDHFRIWSSIRWIRLA